VNEIGTAFRAPRLAIVSGSSGTGSQNLTANMPAFGVLGSLEDKLTIAAAKEMSRFSRSFALEALAFMPTQEHKRFRRVGNWVRGSFKQVH